MPKQIKALPGHGNCAQGTTRSWDCGQEQLFSEDVPMNEPRFFPRPDQATSESVLVCQNYKVTSTSEDHERLH